MARRRRKGLFAILFPDLHRAARKVKHDMRPDRAIGRMMSVPELKAGVRSLTGTHTTHVTGETRKKQVAAIARKDEAAQRRATRVVKPRTVKQGAVKRKKNGQFNGREAMDPRERAMFEQAEQRRVDPVLLPRTPRRRS